MKFERIEAGEYHAFMGRGYTAAIRRYGGEWEIHMYSPDSESQTTHFVSTLKEAKSFVECVAASVTVEVTNLMTGKPMSIPINTPRSCDPSSELYWSM